MDWTIGALLLVVGAIVGFFVAKYFLTQSNTSKKVSHNAISEREMLTEQALIHVASTRKMLDEIQRQSGALKSQLDAYEDLLVSSKQVKDGESFNFFGDQAMTFLKNQQKEAKPVSSNAGFQPPDYSEGASGLLKGGQQNQTENEQKS
ncbi:ZapG family protein [Alteromonas sp. a30]|uniref:ZapG family protein n=1 Tax=Alteromonas sp. a30 TaxID=2730917 RepID=UPI0022806612|nr:DUF1043 family protein [Alteromonas sp. a30]MCY7294810.1 DUF1043 family protein [Alteromonas sp. a30]